MDPINWPAVIAAPLLAAAIAFVWYGPLFGGVRRFAWHPPAVNETHEPARGPVRTVLGGMAINLVPAMMLGHAFARIGADTLAARPWLYWMQSGGIALAFVIPALWIGYARLGVSRRDALVDAGYWVVSYLAIGTIFWATGAG
jgi:hypothetical protein